MPRVYPPPINKYGAVRQTYNGYSYHSKKEAAFAQELDWRVKAKDIKRWERQKKIELKVYEKLICNYFIDFVVYHNDDTKEYVEVKGFETDVWRLKWKLFEAIYKVKEPASKLTIVR